MNRGFRRLGSDLTVFKSYIDVVASGTMRNPDLKRELESKRSVPFNHAVCKVTSLNAQHTDLRLQA